MATSGSPDDSEECSEDSFNQGTGTLPLEEQWYKASRDQLVRPEVATKVVDDDREEHGPGRDIADEGLVLGIDSLSLASKRSHCSAEDSPSSDPPPSYNIPSPVRQVSNEEVHRENQELNEKIDILKSSNQKLRKQVSDLKDKEQELHLRALDLQNKERDQEIRFREQEHELQLEKKRHELHVQRSQSDLQNKKDELELEKQALQVRELKVQVEKQEHEQQMKQKEDLHQAKEQELLTKERGVRAMTLDLKNQQEKNKLYFEEKERDLEFREHIISS